jgi:hypothetical protein
MAAHAISACGHFVQHGVHKEVGKNAAGGARTQGFLKHMNTVDLVQNVTNHDFATLVSRAWIAIKED